ncbi:hypothetical protein BH18ACI4_BH18ACI4_18680 [soil metagenome]
MIVMLQFSILGAAVFAEPSITQIEEVIGLIHGLRLISDAGTLTN